MFPSLLNRLQQIGGGFCPKTRQFRNASILGRRFQFANGFNAQLFIQSLDLLATQPSDFKQFKYGFWKLGLQFFEIFQPVGLHVFGNLLGDGVTDSVQLSELVFGNRVLKISGKSLKRSSGVGVGPDLKRILAL